MLMSEGLVSETQLSLIWEQSCKADAETRQSLLGVLKEVQNELNQNEIIFFINKMLQNPEDMTSEIFDLLVSLKKTAYFKFDNS
jgi:hypothetical protein